MKRTSAGRYLPGYLVLAALLCLLLVLNLNTGSVPLSPREVWDILRAGPGQGERIVWNIRLPRLIAAGVLGGALSVSGFLLQTFFANPIAGPFVLGISSGAKLAVALVMIFFLEKGIVLNSTALILAAFAGSMISMGFILAISGRVKKISLLVICGVMTGYICSAVTDFVIAFADESNIVNLHNWSMGSFSGMSWENVRAILLLVSVTLILTFLLSKPMGAYQLGEVYAANVGVNIPVFRLELILLSTALSACVTAFAGPISFVGVAVPHLAKSLFKTARPMVIIPACFLGGAVFCLSCDLLSRLLFAPTELSISSVTAVLGAPVVIWMMLTRPAFS